MKTLLYYLLAVVLFIPLSSCEDEYDELGSIRGTQVNPDDGPSGPSEEEELDKSASTLVEADNAFGLELFRKIAAEESADSNIFISPVSVALALGMTYNGAAGTTRDAMESTLYLEQLSVEEVNEGYNDLMYSLLNSDPDVLLSIANAIWYEQVFSVKQEFIDLNKTYYDAKVSPMDFADPASVDTVNNWVAENTNDKIMEIIDHISPDVIMYLINAVYFKGTWKYIFEEENTTDRTFYMADNTEKPVPFMNVEEDFAYAELDKCEALKLPYGNESYAMMILLPKKGYTVADVTAQLTADQWDAWMKSFETFEANVYLPKFKFEYKKKLNGVLMTMGMEVAFDMYSADFSNIIDNLQLYISDVKHKTFVEVNEEGTEAAAVTSVEISYYSAVANKVTFDVDKPFLFAIIEENTGAIVFMGRVAEPVYEGG